MNEHTNTLSLMFALLTGASALGDNLESVGFWIKTSVSVILSLLSIFFIVYDRVKAAKRKDSDGGEKITINEAVEIAKEITEELKGLEQSVETKDNNNIKKG